MMMPQSPIDDRFWRYVTHAGITMLAARTLWSLYNQSSNGERSVRDAINRLSTLHTQHNAEEIENVLRELLSILEGEMQNKKGLAKVALSRCMPTLIECTLADIERASVITAATRVISRMCQDDLQCKVSFVESGGVRRLVALLQVAHEQGRGKLMEDLANVLKDITVIKEGDVVLRYDTPQSACAVLSLLKMKHLPTMLRTLDPNARPGFLQSMSGVFANICSLPLGCPVIANGTDGQRGVTYFTPLLDHSSPLVRQYAMRTVKDLALYETARCEEELAEPSVVRKIIPFLDARGPALAVQPALTTCKVMMLDVTGENRERFLREFVLIDGLQALISVWCEHVDPICRSRGERLIELLKVDDTFGPEVMRVMRQREHQIRARRQMDEAERKQEEEMRQKRAFQSMMMSQMGMGPEMLLGGEEE